MNEFILRFLDTVGAEPSMAKDIGPGTDFKSLPIWDSIAYVSMITMYDLEYGKKLNLVAFRNCKTISDLFELTK